MICKAYKVTCPKCGYHYFHQEKVYVCPECGEPRKPCGKKAVKGYKYCDSHGGPNPKHDYYGPGGKMTSGKDSNFPLTRLASKYVMMKKDGRLLSNRASIEVIRGRIEQLAERIDLNQAPDRLENLRKKWERYKQTQGMVDEAASRAELDDEFESAYHDYASWKQMFDAIDLDRKLVESEVKIIKDIRATLTAEDAYELVAQLMAAIITTTNGMKDIPESVKTHFLKRIQYEFTRIVGDRGRESSDGSGGEDYDSEGGELDRGELLHPGDA
jgi:hypothetical protein